MAHLYINVSVSDVANQLVSDDQLFAEFIGELTYRESQCDFSDRMIIGIAEELSEEGLSCLVRLTKRLETAWEEQNQ